MSKKSLITGLSVLIAAMFVFVAISSSTAVAKPEMGSDCASCHNGTIAKKLGDSAAPKPAPAPAPTKPKPAPAKPTPSKTAPAPAAKTTALKINDQSVSALMINGTTLVPVKNIAEIVKITPAWDGAKQTITVKSESVAIVLTVEKDVALVNGKEVKLQAPAKVVNGASYAPLRFIAENLGLKVDFANNAIKVYKALGLNKSGALQGYVGAETCGKCHSGTYKDWLGTNHATMLQNADAKAYNIANFATNEFFKFEDAMYIVAQGQRFVGEKDGKLQYLPATWDAEKRVWVKGTWRDYTCGACHTSGYNEKTGNWAENGITCESCHGPGADHAKAPSKANIKSTLGNEMCSSCHGEDRQNAQMLQQMQAREGKGHLGIFKAASEAEPDRYWDSKCFRCHSATYLVEKAKGKDVPTKEDFLSGSLKEDRVGISCAVCHDPHKKTGEEFQLRKSPLETCTQCHQASTPIAAAGAGGKHTQMEAYEGMYFKADGTKVNVTNPKAGISCVDCHMADGNHIWKVGTPKLTLTSHGKPYEADSCAKCHNDMTEEKIKAYQDEKVKEYAALKTEYDALTAAYGKASAEKQGKAKLSLDVAKTNLTIFEADNSKGIHNTALFETSFGETKKALAAAKEALK